MANSDFKKIKMSKTKICVLLDLYGIEKTEIKRIMGMKELHQGCYYKSKHKGWVIKFINRLKRRYNTPGVKTNTQPSYYHFKEEK